MHFSRNTGLVLAAASLAALGPSSARAATGLIFDDENAVAASHQAPGSGVAGANNGVGATITTAAATPITNFSLLTFQFSAGNLKFLVYDQTTSTFLYQSGPVNFAADTIDGGGNANFTFKESPTFNLTLLPTDTYDLGAIADDDHYYAYDYVNSSPGDTATFTQNGITGPPKNILFQNYASPTTNGTTGTAEFALQIYNGQDNPVPEASTTVSLGVLLALGLGGVVVGARKKKSQDA